VGGFSFYQRAEIKDTVAYLKLAASNSDSVNLLRINFSAVSGTLLPVR